MAQDKPLTTKDLLLHYVLNRAGYETSIRSFQDLENDPEALKIYQSKKTIRRRILRFWDRDPKGENITPENSCFGKMASNKIQLWGATLLDFYFTHRIPSVPSLITVSTSSKLLEWTIKQGETDHAIDEIVSAVNEEAPHEILPFPISEIIEAQEMSIRLGLYGISKSIDNDQRSDETDGVFCPESYPAPWPLLPFSYDAAPLEHHIPLYQLPSTLVVHAPWDLLSVSKSADKYSKNACDWALLEDRTYLYHQFLSKKYEERNKEEPKIEKEKKTRRRHKSWKNLFINAQSSQVHLNHLFSYSTKQLQTRNQPKLHTFILSPAKIVAEGNHSLIVNAEWEIPRSLVVPDILCYECILEDVHQTLIASDGADGSTKDEEWKAKSGIWQKYQGGRDPETFEQIHFDSEKRLHASYVPHSGNLETKYEYVGPFRPIKTNVKWQNGENYCAHISKRLHVDEGTRAHPLTAKVSVVAKLSKEGDDDLFHESNNYEEFPRHFFQHWNGYNVVVPLHNPTPVGALVPQCYGFYNPQEDASREQYLSPIMLLEKCGREVVVDDLNMDDRHDAHMFL